MFEKMHIYCLMKNNIQIKLGVTIRKYFVTELLFFTELIFYLFFFQHQRVTALFLHVIYQKESSWLLTIYFFSPLGIFSVCFSCNVSENNYELIVRFSSRNSSLFEEYKQEWKCAEKNHTILSATQCTKRRCTVLIPP